MGRRIWKAGESLPNGARIMHTRGRLVLAFWTGRHHPWITWKVDDEGNAHSGHYFSSEPEGLKDLHERQGAWT